MTNINIIYTAQTEPSHLCYSNENGQVWMSAGYKENMANIAMNSYSAIRVEKNDSIFVIEPMCILEQNYDVNFLDRFKFIFTWSTKVFENTKVSNKVVHVNLPSYKNNPKIDSSGWLPWDQRADEIVFIANNKRANHPSELYSLRVKLADWFHANSSLKVSWYGNMPINKPYYAGNVKNKYDVLNRVKFSVCIENSYDPVLSYNYLSEKMPDTWFAGTVPIYMGCSNLDELGISQDCYINLLPMLNNFQQLNAKLTSFSGDDYNNMTQSYSKLSDNLYKLTSYENMFKTMLQTYSS